MSGASDRIVAALTAAAAIAATWAAIHFGGPKNIATAPPEPVSFSGDTIKCLVALHNAPDSLGMVNGMSYYVLKSFAEADGFQYEVDFKGYAAHWLDSLESGSLDAMITFRDSLAGRDFPTSFASEEGIVWALAPSHKSKLDSLDRWLSEFVVSEEFTSTVKKYRSVRNPYRAAARSLRLTRLSPYDDIIREYAKSLGWDWRLLASVIYNESKYLLEAESHRGAFGLMQIVPKEHRGKVEITDPEENIKTGVEYLKKLKRFFQRLEIPESEEVRFVLAAYNAGEGRILDCINYAASKGLDASVWDNVASVIPEMAVDSIAVANDFSHGIFKGEETLRYVQNVITVFDIYKEICR